MNISYRTKVIFTLSDEYKSHYSKLYFQLKALLVPDHRFPMDVREIGENYIICYNDCVDRYVELIMSNIPGIISFNVEEV